MTITFRPPVGASTPTGTLPFAVRAVSEVGSSSSAVAEGRLELSGAAGPAGVGRCDDRLGPLVGVVPAVVLQPGQRRGAPVHRRQRSVRRGAADGSRRDPRGAAGRPGRHRDRGQGAPAVPARLGCQPDDHRVVPGLPVRRRTPGPRPAPAPRRPQPPHVPAHVPAEAGAVEARAGARRPRPRRRRRARPAAAARRRGGRPRTRPPGRAADVHRRAGRLRRDLPDVERCPERGRLRHQVDHDRRAGVGSARRPRRRGRRSRTPWRGSTRARSTASRSRRRDRRASTTRCSARSTVPRRRRRPRSPRRRASRPPRSRPVCSTCSGRSPSTEGITFTVFANNEPIKEGHRRAVRDRSTSPGASSRTTPS